MVVKNRNAFTMIELIFAIVIMAITVVSLPMMTQVTSNTERNNLELQEAIYKAVVITKVKVGENSFTTVENAQKLTKTEISGADGLLDYKFNQTYTLEVESNASFYGDTSTDIKRITTKIYSESGDVLTVLHSFKFNI